jgi:hypothetical protein
MISGSSSAAAAVTGASQSEPGGRSGSGGSGAAAICGAPGVDASAFALVERSESIASACTSRAGGSTAGSSFATPFVGLSLSVPVGQQSYGTRSASPQPLLSPRRLPRQLSLPITLRRPRAAAPLAARPGLLTFELDCLTLSRDEVIRVAYDVFTLSGVVEEVGVSEGVLSGFLSAVASHYHEPTDVPYHNLSHAVQVLHMVWLVSAGPGEGNRARSCLGLAALERSCAWAVATQADPMAQSQPLQRNPSSNPPKTPSMTRP